MRRITWMVGTLACAAASAASAAPLDCTKALTGRWVGKGPWAAWGPGVELDNTYTYKADGSFDSVSRYKTKDQPWTQTPMAGKWTAEPKTPTSCKVTLTTSNAIGSSSSTSTYEIVDANTYSALGFPMRRVQP